MTNESPPAENYFRAATDDLPERERHAAIVEPVVSRITSSNTTITPGTGALSFSGDMVIVPSSGALPLS
jgi:hypothetical protein